MKPPLCALVFSPLPGNLICHNLSSLIRKGGLEILSPRTTEQLPTPGPGKGELLKECLLLTTELDDDVGVSESDEK